MRCSSAYWLPPFLSKEPELSLLDSGMVLSGTETLDGMYDTVMMGYMACFHEIHDMCISMTEMVM